MPGFVKTPKDEQKWKRAKEAASKSTPEGSKSYWKLSNYIFHRMNKSGYDLMMADLYKSQLIESCEGHLVKSADELLKNGFGGMLQLSDKSSVSPSLKVPSVSIPSATKMPKAKRLPDASDKPSKFFKSEDFEKIKHPSVRKLKRFLDKKRTKRQS